MITSASGAITVSAMKPVRTFNDARMLAEEINNKIKEFNDIMEVAGGWASVISTTKLDDDMALVDGDGSVITDGLGEIVLEG